MTSQSVEPSLAPLSEAPWSDAASDIDTTTLRESTVPLLTSQSWESPLAGAWPAIQRWLGFVRGLTLAAGSAASCGVAAAGLALLLFLAVVITFTPPTDTFSRRLDMDFSASDLVAEAVFVPDSPPAVGLRPGTSKQGDSRFLAPQQGVDVWVELEVPRGTEQGVAQLVAELTSLDGRPAAKASRALLLRTNSWSFGSLLLAPLRWVGLARDVRRVRLPLFTNYREKREVPFVAAKLAIKTRTPGWAAEVMSARLQVQLRLGIIRRLLYTLRPAPLALLLLGSCGLAALLGGGGAALVFLALLLYAGFGGGGGDSGVVEDEVSSNMADDVEVSSASDVSEASSSMLRELGEDGEPPSPSHHPGMPVPTHAGAPPAVPARIGAGSGGKGKVGSGVPADSAMGSDEGTTNRGGLLRRRARQQ